MINKLKNNKEIVSFYNVTISFLFIVSINRYLFPHDLLGRNTVFNCLLFYFIIKLINHNCTIKLKEKKYPFLFSIIFSLCLLIGRGMYNSNDFLLIFNSFKKIVLFLISWYSFTIVFTEFIYTIFNYIRKTDTNNKQWKIYKTKHIFLFLWIVIFISWIPSFLAYYPGILSYDSRTQTMQAFLGISSYTKFHPPIHTFIWQVCLTMSKIVSINALIIYSIIQMAFLSFVFGRLIKYLIDKNINNYLVLFSILFFTINPVISIFSIIMTKDVYFSGFLILLTIELLKLGSNPKRYLESIKNICVFIFFVVLASLFRNNFIYVFILLIPVLLIVYRKYFKCLIITLCSIVFIYYLINNCFYNALQIGPGNPREMLSVPIQQIACVVNMNDNKLDNNTKSEINYFIDYDTAYKQYNLRFADPVKNTFKTEYFSNNKSDFIRLWIKLLIKYPNEYISSFLSLNLPYWYFDANTTDSFSERVYIETGNYNNDYYNVNRRSKMPNLLKQYEKVASYNSFEGIPIVSNIFSISMPLWLLLFALFSNLYKKNNITNITIIMYILLLMTYIIGPVSNFRYIFPMFAMYPLLFSIILNTKSFE